MSALIVAQYTDAPAAESVIRPATAALIVSPPLALLLWLSGAVSFVHALAATVITTYIVLAAGFLLLDLARMKESSATMAWVVGIGATALVLYALVATLQIVAANAFLVWAVLVVGSAALWRRPPRAAAHDELVALALCAAATLFWCWQLAEVPQALARDGVLTTWVDQFIHGSVISEFGDPLAAGRRTIELADFPRPLYHYASYILPAALAYPLDLPGLTLATSFWVPVGFLTACAGAYALGAALGGTGGGISALGALTLLPDAASYGLHNRLFGYYWYVLAVPTASYAVGVSLAAFVFLRAWLFDRNRRALAAGLALVLGTALIRVHVFLVLLPAWLFSAALAVPVIRRRALGFTAAMLAVFGLLVWGFYCAFPDTPHALDLFLAVTHNEQQPVAYRGLYAGLMAIYGAQVAVPVGVLLVIASTLGLFGILYPLSLWPAWRARRLEGIDLLPMAVLLSYLALMLTAPVPPHGDATELTQRPFVLVYAVFAVWTASGAAVWIGQLGGLRQARIRVTLVAAAALTVFWVLHSTVRDWRWAYTYTVAEGLPEAASFVRSHSARDDLLAAQGIVPWRVTTDTAIQMTALTGVPAYLARPFMPLAAGGARAQVALQRYVALKAIEREPSAAAALERLRSLGIRWYVVAERDGRGPRWDPQRRRAVFVDRMVSLYALR